MVIKTIHGWVTIGAIAVGLSACSHTPSAEDIPPGANFSTNILTDDTKLFTYTQRFMRGGPPLAEADYSSIDNPKAMRERDSIRAAAPKISKKGLEAMLAQNHYCRDGYVVLEQYEEHGAYIIRGECRDSATAAERNKFLP